MTESIESSTLQYYENNAMEFSSGTIVADMNGTRSRFMNLLQPGACILDLGCGSGRDAKAFYDAGYQVEAVDGSAQLCRLASEYIGVSVRQMLFQELDSEEVYDGIWACASILHLPKEELGTTLHRIQRALKPEGILYTSFKYGTYEGLRNGRYFTDFTEETLTAFWLGIKGLHIVETWITGDVRPGREEERWVNLLARRI